MGLTPLCGFAFNAGMKKVTGSLLLFALLAIAHGLGFTQTSPRPIAFTHVTVIDATGSPAQPDMTVVVIGDRIAQLGPSRKIKIQRSWQIIDGKGKFLIPGLWDMHAHLDLVGERLLPVFLANGVTSAREMGGGDFTLLKSWREKIEAGTLPGPRLKLSGPILENPRILPLFEKVTGESMAGKRIGVGRPEEAPAAIETIAGQGADFLKIRTNASRDAYLAIAAEAKRRGLILSGHAPNGVSLLDVSDAGQKSIEHGLVLLNDYTEAQWKEIAARFVRNGTHSVPTLIAGRGYRELPDKDVLAIIDDLDNKIDERRKFASPALLAFWRKQMEMKKLESPMDWGLIRRKNMAGFRILHQAGVRMMAGTDLAVPLVYPGFSLHDELELMVKEIGLTPMEAIESATRIPAEFFGLGESLGTIAKGKLADLVLLDADPLAEIGHTRRIEAVVARGRLYRQTELKKMLSGD